MDTRFQPAAVLKRHVLVAKVRRNGRRCDDAVPAQFPLNLAAVAKPNPLSDRAESQTNWFQWASSPLSRKAWARAWSCAILPESLLAVVMFVIGCSRQFLWNDHR